MLRNKKIIISVVGLGYVGLPLANEFSKYFETIGYDKSNKRIELLRNKKKDTNNQLTKRNLQETNIFFTSEANEIKKANFYIVTVPTPIDKNNKPDLKYLISATEDIAKVLKKGDLVVYESTVYPTCTREICIPILEKISNLKLNKSFYCGYSPERINPGDKKNTVANINKIVSGSNDFALKKIFTVYKKIIKAKLFKASSIEVAEAAKIIENTQRDLNIGLVNEFSQIFNKLKIDTEEVLNMASTKWNFHSYTPGLVGGHCIGVDPYYLTYKSKKIGHYPKIILAGRNVNDKMSNYVAKEVIKKLNKSRKRLVIKKKILILGCTFKENCPDIRNSKIFDLHNHLSKISNLEINIFDPIAQYEEVLNEYGVKILKNIQKNYYDAIILAVPHEVFKSNYFNNIKKKFGKKKCLLFDLKFFYPAEISDFRL